VQLLACAVARASRSVQRRLVCPEEVLARHGRCASSTVARGRVYRRPSDAREPRVGRDDGKAERKQQTCARSGSQRRRKCAKINMTGKKERRSSQRQREHAARACTQSGRQPPANTRTQRHPLDMQERRTSQGESGRAARASARGADVKRAENKAHARRRLAERTSRGERERSRRGRARGADVEVVIAVEHAVADALENRVVATGVLGAVRAPVATRSRERRDVAAAERAAAGERERAAGCRRAGELVWRGREFLWRRAVLAAGAAAAERDGHLGDEGGCRERGVEGARAVALEVAEHNRAVGGRLKRAELDVREHLARHLRNVSQLASGQVQTSDICNARLAVQLSSARLQARQSAQRDGARSRRAAHNPATSKVAPHKQAANLLLRDRDREQLRPARHDDAASGRFQQLEQHWQLGRIAQAADVHAVEAALVVGQDERVAALEGHIARLREVTACKTTAVGLRERRASRDANSHASKTIRAEGADARQRSGAAHGAHCVLAAIVSIALRARSSAASRSSTPTTRPSLPTCMEDAPVSAAWMHSAAASARAEGASALDAAAGQGLRSKRVLQSKLVEVHARTAAPRAAPRWCSRCWSGQCAETMAGRWKVHGRLITRATTLKTEKPEQGRSDRQLRALSHVRCVHYHMSSQKYGGAPVTRAARTYTSHPEPTSCATASKSNCKDAHQAREQRGGDATAGADVEHLVALLHLEALDHARVHVCTRGAAGECAQVEQHV
jgi:hypothetical protein